PDTGCRRPQHHREDRASALVEDVVDTPHVQVGVEALVVPFDSFRGPFDLGDGDDTETPLEIRQDLRLVTTYRVPQHEETCCGMHATPTVPTVRETRGHYPSPRGAVGATAAPSASPPATGR